MNKQTKRKEKLLERATGETSIEGFIQKNPTNENHPVCKKVNQGRPKSSKTRKKSGAHTYAPLPQQQRIKEKYVKGMSIRQIAKEEGKARETVTKIVHSEEMQQQVKRMREELYGLIPDIIEVLRRAIVSGKLGARLAIELLDRFGIFELCREEILGPAVK